MERRPQARDLEYIDDRIRQEYAGGPTADAGRGRAEAELRQAHLARRDSRLVDAQATDTAASNARSQARAARTAAAAEQEAIWATWRREPHGRRGISAVSRTSSGARRVLILDDQGAELGQWHLPNGPLTLVDERLRADAQEALQTHGIASHPSPDLDDLTDFPNATVTIRGSSWSVRSSQDGRSPDRLLEIGRYDQVTEVVTVYARPHQEPVQSLLRRHGVEADSVWVIDPPVEPDNRHAADPEIRLEAIQPRLRNRVRGHLPAEHAQVLRVQWGKGPVMHHSTHRELRGNPYYLRELGTLLGAPADELRSARCRLCYNNALAGPNDLAYCFTCVRSAQGRLLRDTATDGHPCRSMLERHIDDFLHRRGIAHEIEPSYPWHADLNTTGLRADWLLRDGTYVEALGMPDEPAYAAKITRKRELAQHAGIRLITLTAKDLTRFPEIFAAWMPAAEPTS